MEENKEITEETTPETVPENNEFPEENDSEIVLETGEEALLSSEETLETDVEFSSEYINEIVEEEETEESPIMPVDLGEYADSEWRQSRDAYYRTHYHDIYVQHSEYGWDNIAYYQDCSPYENKWQYLYDYDIGDYVTNEDGSWTPTEHKYKEVAVYVVCYDQYGNAAYYDEFGELHIIDDWENIVFSNSPEGWEPWLDPEESEPEEPDDPLDPDPNYPDSYIEVPFMEKPLDDYTVTEGILALTLVLFAVLLIGYILKD